MGKMRYLPYSQTEEGATWNHITMRKVWGEWMETMQNITNPGGGERYGNNSMGVNTTWQIETGFYVFGQRRTDMNATIRQATALVKEIAVFNSYNPADGDGWTKLLAAYGNPNA